MGANHVSPLEKEETIRINNWLMYKIHNSDDPKFCEEHIKQLSMLKKLSKLHLEGKFKEGNWFHHICSMTNLK